MTRRNLIASLAVALLTMLLAVGVSASAQALSFTPCQSDPSFSCTTLGVPLERSGGVPGDVALNVERLQTGPSPSHTAVLGLAGGPGQAATPLAGAMAEEMAPALAGRDLIVFDQRGTGTSGPLACTALEGNESLRTIGQAFERCAQQIGPARGAYTSQESVADIETIRQALGYEKLVLFGVSYGTKVALEYAERYPQSTEALVLDSVVPSERDDPFTLATFKAMKPVFEELCSANACAGITNNPLGDIASLVAKTAKHALRGYVYDGSGHRHLAVMSDVDLLNLISAGDLNPALRALLPSAVQSALRGDPQPLLRLNLLSEGLIPNLPGVPLQSSTASSASARDGAAPGVPQAGPGGIDEALFIDTTCEEQPAPWQRTAAPKTRLTEALGALHALPGSDFYPFTTSIEWADSVLPGCAYWPNLAPTPPPIVPLPDVPALILSGAQDLRTPTSGAEAVAARIPGSQLLVVPYTGHSVLGTDFSGCAQAAVSAFFGGQTVQQCVKAANPFSPTPITPTKLSSVEPVSGVPGNSGRTLTVVLDTIIDLERQVVGATLQSEQALPSGASFGGLRGGYARITSSALRLSHMSFVAGVQVSGTFPISGGHLDTGDLHVEGSRAAHGTVRIGSTPIVSGTLAGKPFSVNITDAKLSRVGTLLPRLGLNVRFPSPELARTP
jgi:pimeloyl-ACP methyl ester carboxylesterase